LLSDEAPQDAWRKIVVAHDAARVAAFSDDERRLLQRAGGHFSSGAATAQLLEAASLDCLRPVGGDDFDGDARACALGLAQTLSLVQASAVTASATTTTTTGQVNGNNLHADYSMKMDYTIREATPDMTVARLDDMSLAEYAAFNHGHNYPHMRRWELPFALHKARLSGTMSVLDCTINPVDFGARLQGLYAHVLYRHHNPIQRGQFALPLGVPDEAFDRVVCINTLEHLLAHQREALVAEMSRKLKPGGLLVLTSDFYFDDSRTHPDLLRMGVVRADREEVFNGWNCVSPEDLLNLCARHGLRPLSDGAWATPDRTEAGLYRNVEPHPHACIGGVFKKGRKAALLPAPKKVTLALLTWNMRDISLESLGALVSEAAMLRRLGHDASVVVCDNGSTDGLQDALRAADERIEIEHRFILNEENRGSSVARNRIIDHFLETGGDYLLFTDGDIELVPCSSFAMLRHMEDSGHLLGCLGAHMYGQSPLRTQATPYLYSLAGMQLRAEEVVAWTQYGLFRREVFEAGVRFDVAHPFDREGWGCEDNDLAFQMLVKGYAIQCFSGMTYLHRNMHSSMRVLRALGLDPVSNYETRKRYVIEKWAGTPAISGGPLKHVRSARAPTGL
jgi:GT2 family glycosyltransferase